MVLFILPLGLVLVFGASPTMSTAVGTGRAGDSGDGGPAAQALLNQPFDLVFDAAGNLYLADTGNHRIRHVDRSGTITTVAGDGTKGFAGDGGPATQARLNEPYGLALDGRGNLYFADRLNGRVRRVDGDSGVITTIAGDGSKTFSGDGGPGQRQGLVEPNGVALDRRRGEALHRRRGRSPGPRRRPCRRHDRHVRRNGQGEACRRRRTGDGRLDRRRGPWKSPLMERS